MNALHIAGLDWTRIAPSMTAAFLASLVEFVEALTIVLAVGTVRGWRHALAGTGLGLLLLVVLVAALGPLLARIPLDIIQALVGALLLLFGLRWLRKAVLRSAGIIPLHDETAAFAKEAELLRAGAAPRPRGWDRVAVATAFQITVLEGVEVVFTVVAIGAGGGLLVPASLAAGAALLVVVLLGLLLHRPLARIPENLLKFAVGVLLSAFGTFWVGEGLGLTWPGADWAILALVAAFTLAAVAAASWARRKPSRAGGAQKPGSPEPPDGTRLRAVVGEILALFVDDGLLAILVLAWIAAFVLLLRLASGPVRSDWAGAVLFAGIAGLLVESVLRAARRSG